MAVGRILVGVACISGLSGGPALAQVAAPTGQTGGLFGRMAPVDSAFPSQRLTLQISGSTGRDRNTDDDGNDLPATSFGAQQSGGITTADASATYSLTKGLTNVTAAARTFVNFASEGAGTIYGTSGSLDGSIALTTRTGLVVNGSVSYDPTILFDAFSPVDQPIENGGLPGGVPGAAPTQGVSTGRFVSLGGSGGMYHSWTTRQRTTVSGTLARRSASRSTESDNTWYGGGIQHTWAPRQRLTVSTGYRIDSQDLVTAFRSDTVYSQTGDVSLSLVRPVSPTRALTIGLGAGAAWMRSPSEFTRTNVSVVVPTFAANVGMTLIRGWEIGVDARRDVTILRGLAPEPFKADAASLRVSGTPTERLQLQLALGGSRGRTERGNTGSFDVVTGVAQLQFAVSRYIGLSSGVYHYIHTLRDVATVDPLFPLGFRRTSFRVGATVWLPVIGRF